MKYILVLLCLGILALNLKVYLAASKALSRAESLNKRADMMQKEWRKLDLRIKKQEGITHGWGS